MGDCTWCRGACEQGGAQGQRGVQVWMAALPYKAGKRLSSLSVPEQPASTAHLSNVLPVCSQHHVPSAIWARLPGHKAASVPSLLSLAILQSLSPTLKSASTHKASVCP